MRVKDARQTFLGIWLRRLVEGKPFHVFGDGLQVRDYNHVDDVVDAMLLAATSEQAYGQIYNLGAAPPISLLDTAELLVKLHGRGRFDVVPFPKDRKAIDIGDYYGDFSKITRELGWQPRVSLERGLAGTLAFYEAHHAQYWETSEGVTA
jgi:nucleoside-diphosphate-sugar epimerase